MKLRLHVAAVLAAIPLFACEPDDPIDSDSVAPSLVSSEPPTDSEHLPYGTLEVTFEFDEPMDAASGALAGPGGVAVTGPQWDGARAAFSLQGLSPSTRYTFELSGFRDLAGNELQPTRFAFVTAPSGADFTRPRVVASVPENGSTDLYPTQFFLEDGQLVQRKALQVTFDEPMAEANAVVLREVVSGATRTLTPEWSEDLRTLTVTLLRTDEGRPPLEAETEYELDLRPLTDTAGNAVDRSSATGGALRFTTTEADHVLEHSCSHTVHGPFQSVTAAEVDTFPPPAVDSTHTLYTVALPETAQGHAGDLSSWPAEEGQQVHLFLERDAAVQVFEEGTNHAIPLQRTALPPICPNLTVRVDFIQPPAPLLLRFGPTSAPEVRILLEHGS